MYKETVVPYHLKLTCTYFI